MDELLVDKMVADDWSDIARIYNQGIATKNATFEINVTDWITWDRNHRQDCRLVAKIAGRNVGWAALSDVSGRFVYSGVAEVSIYVDTEFQNQGIGDRLLKSLIEESEKNGIWTLQAGIFPENKASIRLHEKNGFRIVGIRERIGKMDGIWRDIVILERRSNKCVFL